VKRYSDKFLDIFYLIFTFFGQPKKEHTVIFKKSYMCQELMNF